MARDKRLDGIPGYDTTPVSDAFVFDSALADRAIDFIEKYIKHMEGALDGKPFLLEFWQKCLVANIFGWVDKVTRYRRYREVFLFVPKKNGKTPLCASIALYVLFCDKEPGAQNYLAAAEREQAALLFRQAKGMIDHNPKLASRCRMYGSLAQRSIILNSDPGSFLKVISSDANTKHGANSHLIMIDELHAQKNRELVDALQTSQASANRVQPLLVHITTSDYEREGSICNEKHKYACEVRDKLMIDDRFLPMIYEASLDDDWTDPKTWAKANPNLGVSVSLDYIERECKHAQASPAYENTFKRMHLNIRTEMASRWLSMDKWDTCREIDRDALLGQKCYAGLDLASTKDISALGLVFRREQGYDIIMRYWVPKEGARERSLKANAGDYLTWIRDGYMVGTEGNVTDYDVIRADINEIGKKYNILEIGIDMWNATQLAVQLEHDGLKVEMYGQGFKSMSSPSKLFDAAIVSGRLGHGGCPVLRWMASNATALQDPAGNIKPDKSKSGDKIDGIVAIVMGIGLASRGQDQTSVYTADRGLVSI